MQDNCPRHECLNPCQNKFELSLPQGAAYLLGDWHELGLSNIQRKKKKKKSHYYYYYSNYNYYQDAAGEFPSGPADKTRYSQCRRPGFDPWSGNQIPHVTTKDPTYSI